MIEFSSMTKAWVLNNQIIEELSSTTRAVIGRKESRKDGDDTGQPLHKERYFS